MFKFINVILLLILSSASLFSQTTAIQVDVVGKGPDIMLLPGFACPSDVWSNLVQEFKETHTCHLVNYAGFNGMPPVGDKWLSKVKTELEGYILKNNIQPMLVGHSLGGTLAMWIGIDKNVEIKKIVSVDALASVGALMIPNFHTDMISHNSPQNLQMINMPDDTFKGMAFEMSKSMVLDTSYHKLISGWMANSDRKTYVNGYTDLLKIDLRNELDKISVPVSIIAATHPYGKEVVSQTFQEQFDRLDNYEIFYAENSAHFIMFDEPIWLENIIQQIISE